MKQRIKMLKCRNCKRNIGLRLQSIGWPLDGYCAMCTARRYDVCESCAASLHTSILATGCHKCTYRQHSPTERVLGIIFGELERDMENAKGRKDRLALASFLFEASANALRLADDVLNNRLGTAEEHMERIRYLSRIISEQFKFPRNIAAEWEIRIKPPQPVDKRSKA